MEGTMMEIEGTPIEPDKSQNILATLREHLMIAFPHLSLTLPLNQIRNDTAGNISMVMPLRSKSEPTGSTDKGYINMGLPLDTPTFMLQFTPIAIIPDAEGDASNLSSKTVIDVSVATYHGVILKKDYLTFSIHYNNPSNLDEAELRTTTCELLSKLELFPDGFRLCSGLENVKGLHLNDVFIEPFGESRSDLVIIRSRKCEFMLEMEEMYSSEKLDLDRNSCLQCGMLRNEALCMKIKDHELAKNEGQIDEESDSREPMEYELSDDEALANLDEDVNQDKDPNWKHGLSVKKSQQDSDFYSCNHCSRKFKTLRALQRHKDYEASNSKWKCLKCGKKYKTEIIYKTHKCSTSASNTEVKTVASGVKKRKKRGSIKRIVKRIKTSADENEDKKEYCHLCFRDFTMQTRFEQHMDLHKKRIEHLYEETICPLETCGKSFADRIQLSAHFNDHDQENSPCAYCLKVLKKEKMRAHVFAEHPYQQFQCNICNKICSFQSQLKQHTIEAHSADKPKDVVCDVCGNRYRKEAGLRQHMASAHSAFREYQCMTCGKGFTTQARLTQHSRIHTGVKPFKCVKCDYKSNRSDNVLFHLRKVHKMERPSKGEHVVIQEDLLTDPTFLALKVEHEAGDSSGAGQPLTALIVNEIAA